MHFKCSNIALGKKILDNNLAWLRSSVSIESEHLLNYPDHLERIDVLHKTNSRYVSPRGTPFVIRISFHSF